MVINTKSESVLIYNFNRNLHQNIHNKIIFYKMNTTLGLSVEKTKLSKINEVEWENLSFGTIPTDHMFICNYKQGNWQEPKIVPFQPISLSPFAHCFHYGQTIFEGLKAFRREDGDITVFRPGANYKRMAISAERMCMPVIPRDIYFEGMHSLLELDEKWLPLKEDVSLYIRPFMIATEPKMGVKVSDQYSFMIVASPSGKYFSSPLRLKVETEFVRTAEGGVGYAKCGGNYGASYYPAQQARDAGFDQVIWTDCKNHEYIEESGVMNIMLVVDDELITPALSTSILAGITRESMLLLGKEYGLKPVERNISVKELRNWLAEGKVKEAFGAGTAAVISPIKEIAIGEELFSVPIKNNSFMTWAKQMLNDIKRGTREDIYNWNYVIRL